MKKIILVVVTILVLLPLFKTGLFDVHDETSIIRMYTLSSTLGSGQWPAAWTNELNHGFGYPLFLYYAPVFTYLGALLKLFVPTYLLALKLSMGLLVGIASLGMYRLMRQFLPSMGALISSVAYTYLPYHASTLYVRGSYAEGVTWALLPWLLYIWSLPKRDHRWVATSTIITSLFLLSHNSLPFVFLPFLLIWIFMFARKSYRSSLLAIFLSVGVSLWFLLPVFFERGFVQVETIASLTKYSDHFLRIDQLYHSPWGYGGSARVGEADGMSFMLGKAQLVLALLALGVVLVRKKIDKVVIFLLSCLLFYSMMTLEISRPIWDMVSGIQILQFPWRMLAFASFTLSAISGYLIFFIPKKFQLFTTAFALIMLVFFNLKFFNPQRTIVYDDAHFLSQEKLDTVAMNKIPEYLPYDMPTFPATKIEDGLTRTSTAVYGELDLSDTAPLIISTAFMPQWELTLNGLHQPIKPSSLGSIETVDDVQHGNYLISLTWHRTVLENVGIIVSLGSALAVIGLLLL